MNFSTQELSESILKNQLGTKNSSKNQTVGHQAKVAFINLNRILQETHEGKKRGDKLQTLAQDKEKALEQKIAELEALEKQAKSAGNGRYNDLLQKKTEEVNQARNAAQQELDKLQQAALMEMEQLTIPILQQLIQERGISMILSYPQPGVVFVSEQLDITDELVRRLNGT